MKKASRVNTSAFYPILFEKRFYFGASPSLSHIFPKIAPFSVIFFPFLQIYLGLFQIILLFSSSAVCYCSWNIAFFFSHFVIVFIDGFRELLTIVGCLWIWWFLCVFQRDCRCPKMMPNSSSSNKLVKIDISSDTVCPWCFIGKKNLDKAIASSQDQYNFEVLVLFSLLRLSLSLSVVPKCLWHMPSQLNVEFDLQIKWHPYQLDPAAPKGVNKREYYRRKFGSRSEGMEARMSEVFCFLGL